MMDGMGLEKSKNPSFSAILHPKPRGFECYFLPDFKPAGILRVQPAVQHWWTQKKNEHHYFTIGDVY